MVVSKVRVEAVNPGSHYSTAFLNVSVNRNLFQPFFTPSIYSVTILESEPLSTPFISVSAVDNDLQVLCSKNHYG